MKLYAANDTPIRTYGRAMLPLDLGIRRAITWPFVISDVPIAIIGADLLDHFGLLVDIKHRQLINPLTSLRCTGKLAETDLHSVATCSSSQVDHLKQPIRDLLIEYADITKP